MLLLMSGNDLDTLATSYVPTSEYHQAKFSALPYSVTERLRQRSVSGDRHCSVHVSPTREQAKALMVLDHARTRPGACESISEVMSSRQYVGIGCRAIVEQR